MAKTFLEAYSARRFNKMQVTAAEKVRKSVADLARAMNRLAPLAPVAPLCPDYESDGPLACDCEDCFRVDQHC